AGLLELAPVQEPAPRPVVLARVREASQEELQPEPLADEIGPQPEAVVEVGRLLLEVVEAGQATLAVERCEVALRVERRVDVPVVEVVGRRVAPRPQLLVNLVRGGLD